MCCQKAKPSAWLPNIYWLPLVPISCVKNRKLTKNPGAVANSSGVMRFIVVFNKVEEPSASAMPMSSTV